MKLIKNKQAVSQLIGYLLVLGLTAVVVASTILMTNSIIDDKKIAAAEIYAENLANQIKDKIVNMCLVKQQYPNANYTNHHELPVQLMDEYGYYIEIVDEYVYVNSTNGRISTRSDTIKAPEKLFLSLNDKMYGGSGLINLTCNKFDYVHRFDFGTDTSSVEKGFSRISDTLNSNNWHYGFRDCKYRTTFEISNPISGQQPYTDYQILLQFDDTEFDYSTANETGSDIRFMDQNGISIPYWIERWNPMDSKTSRVWVNLTATGLPDGGCTIYMYHGNTSVDPVSESNGDATFDFFDDFSDSALGKWDSYISATGNVEASLGKLVITDGSAVYSKSAATTGLDSFVVETKAKATGDPIREASLFINHDGSSIPPYKKAVVLSNGNFSDAEDDSNMTILVYDGGSSTWINQTSKMKIGVNQDWNRLSYFINLDGVSPNENNDNIICRYFYGNYTAQAAAGVVESSYIGDEHIGLCTLKTGTTAYYDWVFVRKYVVDNADTVTTREEAVPVASIKGMDSRDFKWGTNVNSDDDGGGNDYIYGNNHGIITIYNLTDSSYSLTFVVGDNVNPIDGMTISITGDPADGTHLIGDISCETYVNKYITGIMPDPADHNSITIDFIDTDSTYYWAVNRMSIQKGDRTIELTGGK